MNNIIESAECTVVTKRLINNAIEHLTLEQIKDLYVQKGGDLGESQILQVVDRDKENAYLIYAINKILISYQYAMKNTYYFAMCGEIEQAIRQYKPAQPTELIGEQIIHAKPVGIAIQSSMYKGVTLATFDANSVPVNTKLYTKPINPGDVAKDGYVLVPLEPTDEMIEAGRLQGKLNELEFRLRDEGARLIYKAMLASNGKDEL